MSQQSLIFVTSEGIAADLATLAVALFARRLVVSLPLPPAPLGAPLSTPSAPPHPAAERAI